MNIHLDFSIFLLDGAAFGKAACNAFLPGEPKQGDILLLAELVPQATRQALKPEALTFAESKLGKLRVSSVRVLSSDSSGSRMLVETDDVVLDTREGATRLVNVLDSLGFDCDVWAEVKKP